MKPRDILCPSCGAPPGSRCITCGGKLLGGKMYHWHRRQLAKKAPPEVPDIQEGDVVLVMGTVIHVYGDGRAYEVAFDGKQTLAIKRAWVIKQE